MIVKTSIHPNISNTFEKKVDPKKVDPKKGRIKVLASGLVNLIWGCRDKKFDVQAEREKLFQKHKYLAEFEHIKNEFPTVPEIKLQLSGSNVVCMTPDENKKLEEFAKKVSEYIKALEAYKPDTAKRLEAIKRLINRDKNASPTKQEIEDEQKIVQQEYDKYMPSPKGDENSKLLYAFYKLYQHQPSNYDLTIKSLTILGVLGGTSGAVTAGLKNDGYSAESQNTSAFAAAIIGVVVGLVVSGGSLLVTLYLKNRYEIEKNGMFHNIKKEITNNKSQNLAQENIVVQQAIAKNQQNDQEAIVFIDIGKKAEENI